jgi:DNA-binding NtrC family response regulator
MSVTAASGDRFAAHGLLGTSAAMRALEGLIDRAAGVDGPVLIVGEAGTGKELVARAIHVESRRRDGAFVAVDCAALPERLLDCELFGHVAGAFPGVDGAARGQLAEADGGTVYLEEVGTLPPALQAKLLRVLEAGEVAPVGGDAAVRRVDVRCVASTPADLDGLTGEGAFSVELLRRLGAAIPVPPLRARREDVALLADHLLGRTEDRLGIAVQRALTPGALEALEAYAWPGNVRELENVVERLAVTTRGPRITAEAVRAALAPVAPGVDLGALRRRARPRRS